MSCCGREERVEHRAAPLALARGGAGRPRGRRPLEGAARADVAIMGGGYVGLWTAHPHQGARSPGLRRRRARAGHLRRRRQRPQRRRSCCRGGPSSARSSSCAAASGRARRSPRGGGRRDRRDRRRSANAHGIDADYRPRRLAVDGHAPRRSSAPGMDRRADCASWAPTAFERAGRPRRSRGARDRRAHRRACSSRRAATVQPAEARRAACAASRSSWASASTSTRVVTRIDRSGPRCCDTTAASVDGRQGRDRHQRLGGEHARAAHARWSSSRATSWLTEPIARAAGRDRLDRRRVHHRLAADDPLLPHAPATGAIAFGKGGWGIALRRADRRRLRPTTRGARELVEHDLRLALPAAGRRAGRRTTGAGPIDRSPTGLPMLGHLGGTRAHRLRRRLERQRRRAVA